MSAHIGTSLYYLAISELSQFSNRRIFVFWPRALWCCLILPSYLQTIPQHVPPAPYWVHTKNPNHLLCYQSTPKPNHIKVHDYSNILGPFRKHTVKMIRGHRSNSRDFKHNFCKREGPRAINWKLVIPPKNTRFPSSEGGLFLQIMARVERDRGRWRGAIAEEWAKLNDPGHTFSADLVLLYNRHMECALLHASSARVLLASLPSAIKDGIGHTSALEPVPSFALTPARNWSLPLNLEIWPLAFSGSGI